MIGAKAIIRCLEEEGVKTVFGYPGGAVLPLYDELRKSEIQHVLVRNEQSAPHYASGYARSSEKVGVCIATSGPGATNLITGIATAYMDSIPIVIITGQVSRSLIGTDAFQEADITGATEPFTKHNYLVRSAEDIPRVMKEAFYIAQTGRPGPVLVDVPVDVQKEMLKFAYPEGVDIPGYKPTYEGHRGQIKRAISKLKNAKRPVIYAGGGVISSQASEELTAFAQESKIPVVNSLMGIGSFPHDSKYYAGILGSHGYEYSNKVMSRADVVMLVGVRLSDRATKRLEDINPDMELIHIDIDPAEIGKNMETTIPVVGDAKNILSCMLEKNIQIDTEEWIEEIKEMKGKCVYGQQKCEVEKLSPKHVMNVVSKEADDSCTVVADVGQNQIWAARNYSIKGKRKYFTSGGLGTMGYSLPASAGIKMADRERQVVCVVGDAGIQMCLGELGTLSEYSLGVKVILFNNSRLGMVRELQDNAYGLDKNHGVEFGHKVDFVAIAKAYGIEAKRVETNEEFEKVFADTIGSDNPFLIECIVDPGFATI
ncbi:acetolactate synthase, large subunit [Peptoclostridium litorale DSM 5388]|uniref:Acetolactate synthase n=1 Tax=Peptoclostridium litorale DSM 5388 TaxID=1121324 RepID=A0A069RJZ7_PEPLI|nr:biosynthetic-type acetolactate synthase large subunit [Peptoclostridium litorale]KDR96465.1 putative acetolactate synthase large subunit IlvB [Peptoclostridium litorale DSM 5388]SIN70271.1 acetolactate synthase, large subunit [Peptoclostridium litorale DSM 5388]